ncbi:MAG: hypothetical protein LBI39_00030 [Puniceicoccales bacterium]|jgi:hypothetical protein|nr:hypothetical protein [Puniceicoccales bacterium]
MSGPDLPPHLSSSSPSSLAAHANVRLSPSKFDADGSDGDDAEAQMSAVADAVAGAPNGAAINASIAPNPLAEPASGAAAVASSEGVDVSKITVTLRTRKFFYDWASQNSSEKFNDPAFALRYACFRIDAFFERISEFIKSGKWRLRDYIDKSVLERKSVPGKKSVLERISGSGSGVGGSAKVWEKDNEVGAISFSVAGPGNIKGCAKVGRDIAAVANGIFGEEPNIRSGGYHCAGIFENLMLQQMKCDGANENPSDAEGAAKWMVGKENSLCTIAYSFLTALTPKLFAETVVELCSNPETLPLLTGMLEKVEPQYAQAMFEEIKAMPKDARKAIYGKVGPNGESMLLASRKIKGVHLGVEEDALKCLGKIGLLIMARKVASRHFGKSEDRDEFMKGIKKIIRKEEESNTEIYSEVDVALPTWV